MRKIILGATVCLTLLSGQAYAGSKEKQFTLVSSEIASNAMIDKKFEFNGFGCQGQNQSPSLKWTNAPTGTKSFAVTAYDPDAPTGSGWWHWFVVNLPVTTTELLPNAGSATGENLPKDAVQVRSDYGTKSWGGVCPPAGDKAHRYIFTVYALKTEKLDLPENASPALAGFMVNANKLGQASFTAKYARPSEKASADKK